MKSLLSYECRWQADSYNISHSVGDVTCHMLIHFPLDDLSRLLVHLCSHLSREKALEKRPKKARTECKEQWVLLWFIMLRCRASDSQLNERWRNKKKNKNNRLEGERIKLDITCCTRVTLKSVRLMHCSLNKSFFSSVKDGYFHLSPYLRRYCRRPLVSSSEVAVSLSFNISCIFRSTLSLISLNRLRRSLEWLLSILMRCFISSSPEFLKSRSMRPVISLKPRTIASVSTDSSFSRILTTFAGLDNLLCSEGIRVSKRSRIDWTVSSILEESVRWSMSIAQMSKVTTVVFIALLVHTERVPSLPSPAAWGIHSPWIGKSEHQSSACHCHCQCITSGRGGRVKPEARSFLQWRGKRERDGKETKITADTMTQWKTRESIAVINFVIHSRGKISECASIYQKKKTVERQSLREWAEREREHREERGNIFYFSPLHTQTLPESVWLITFKEIALCS